MPKLLGQVMAWCLWQSSLRLPRRQLLNRVACPRKAIESSALFKVAVCDFERTISCVNATDLTLAMRAVSWVD